MMLKVLPLTALALGLSSGAAFADRGRGDRHDGNEHRSSDHVRDHRGDSHRGNTVVVRDHGWRGNNVVVRDHGSRGGSRVIVRNTPSYRDHAVRRPIYVSRPVIRERYYNYYRRPAIIVENYDAMPGYYWVTGRWTWSGYEWTWQPGHYEPDANYTGYYDGY